jgi:hypothetical protein
MAQPTRADTPADTRADTPAPTVRRAARTGVPWSAGDRRRGAWASAGPSWRKPRGGAISGSLLSVATVFSPPSLPTCCPRAGRSDGSAHAPEPGLDHWPVRLRRRVAVLGVPCRGRCTTTFTSPTVMPRKRFLSAANGPPPGPGGNVRLAERPGPRQRGSPGSFTPSRIRRKPAGTVQSRRTATCCTTCDCPVASAGRSAVRAGHVACGSERRPDSCRGSQASRRSASCCWDRQRPSARGGATSRACCWCGDQRDGPAFRSTRGGP